MLSSACAVAPGTAPGPFADATRFDLTKQGGESRIWPIVRPNQQLNIGEIAAGPHNCLPSPSGRGPGCAWGYEVEVPSCEGRANHPVPEELGWVRKSGRSADASGACHRLLSPFRNKRRDAFLLPPLKTGWQLPGQGGAVGRVSLLILPEGQPFLTSGRFKACPGMPFVIAPVARARFGLP